MNGWQNRVKFTLGKKRDRKGHGIEKKNLKSYVVFTKFDLILTLERTEDIIDLQDDNKTKLVAFNAICKYVSMLFSWLYY